LARGQDGCGLRHAAARDRDAEGGHGPRPMSSRQGAKRTGGDIGRGSGRGAGAACDRSSMPVRWPSGQQALMIDHIRGGGKTQMASLRAIHLPPLEGRSKHQPLSILRPNAAALVPASKPRSAHRGPQRATGAPPALRRGVGSRGTSNAAQRAVASSHSSKRGHRIASNALSMLHLTPDTLPFDRITDRNLPPLQTDNRLLSKTLLRSISGSFATEIVVSLGHITGSILFYSVSAILYTGNKLFLWQRARGTTCSPVWVNEPCI